MHNFSNATLNVGQIIPFGQTEVFGYKVPLGWQVLKVNGGKTLVISENVLCFRKPCSLAQHDAPWKSNYYTSYNYDWDNCDISKYLNSDFISEFGLENINIVSVPRTVEIHGERTSKNYKDKVFLLTSSEANAYFRDSKSRIAKDLRGNPVPWLLASSGNINSFSCDRVSDYGVISKNSNTVSTPCGIRPAFWFSIA